MISIICRNCSKEFFRDRNSTANRNIYCSRSCAVTVNNKIGPRRKAKIRICKVCKTNYTNSISYFSKGYCKICKPKILDSSYYKNISIGQYNNTSYLADKHPSWKNAQLRNFNRHWNSDLRGLPCQVCNYSAHVELAHIKSISSFDETVLLGVVNSPENILVLCPNHHWEFDNELLLLSDIPTRVG